MHSKFFVGQFYSRTSSRFKLFISSSCQYNPRMWNISHSTIKFLYTPFFSFYYLIQTKRKTGPEALNGIRGIAHFLRALLDKPISPARTIRFTSFYFILSLKDLTFVFVVDVLVVVVGQEVAEAPDLAHHVAEDGGAVAGVGRHGGPGKPLRHRLQHGRLHWVDGVCPFLQISIKSQLSVT